MHSILCLLYFLFSLTSVKSCLYARKGDSYHPVDVCISYDDWGFSMEHHCSNEMLFELLWTPSTHCTGSPQHILNETTGQADFGNCNATDLCDYVGYTVFRNTDGNNLDCNSLPTASWSTAEIINECVYMETYNLYYINTCIEGLWTVTYFTDSECNGDPYDVFHFNDQCDSTQSYHFDITTCTKPMNQITNKCGYVQQFKNSNIIPLNRCIIQDENSFSYKCVDDTVYVDIWNSNNCGTEPDYNYTILPISYSCSEQQCSSVYITEYENNNCTEPKSNLNYTTIGLVTDECFNWFDKNNDIWSSKYVCDAHTKSYSQYIFIDPDCQTLSEVISFTEQCLNNIQLSITCDIVTDKPTIT
eukprot:259076_1